MTRLAFNKTYSPFRKELSSKTEKRISGYICKLIDNNQKLQHLDISDTGMSSTMIS